MVIDWRARISAGRSTGPRRTEPMGVDLRRRFGFDHGRLTAYEDEHLARRAEADAAQPRSSRPRSSGRASARCATSSPRSSRSRTRSSAPTSTRRVCVQGAPGTGKTAVGLHRAAWLLYAYRDQLPGRACWSSARTAPFLDHIGAVLPALGEVDVAADDDRGAGRQRRPGVRGRATPTAVAVLKGDARMAAVLRRGRSGPTSARRPRRWSCRAASRRWRVPAYEVQEIVDELRARGRALRRGARPMLPQRLAHAVLLQMERAGDSPDDRVQDAVARSRAGQGLRRRAVAGGRPGRVLCRCCSRRGAPRRGRRRAS